MRFTGTAGAFVRLINRIRFDVPSDLVGIDLVALGLGFTILRGDYLDLARRFVRSVINSIGEDVPNNIRIIPVPHHLAHATSAYYFSGFDNATVLSVDGHGEFEATTVWRVRDGEFEKITSVPTVYGSLGFLYEIFSIKIGYEILEGPGKVMGLAPYGKASKYYEKLKSFIRFDDKDYPFRFMIPGKWRVKGKIGDYYEPYVLLLILFILVVGFLGMFVVNFTLMLLILPGLFKP